MVYRRKESNNTHDSIIRETRAALGNTETAAGCLLDMVRKEADEKAEKKQQGKNLGKVGAMKAATSATAASDAAVQDRLREALADKFWPSDMFDDSCSPTDAKNPLEGSFFKTYLPKVAERYSTIIDVDSDDDESEHKQLFGLTPAAITNAVFEACPLEWTGARAASAQGEKWGHPRHGCVLRED